MSNYQRVSLDFFFHIEVMRNRGLPYSDFWVSSPWSSLGFHSNMPGHPSPQSIHNYIYTYVYIYRLLYTYIIYILYIYVNHNYKYISYIYILEHQVLIYLCLFNIDRESVNNQVPAGQGLC